MAIAYVNSTSIWANPSTTTFAAPALSLTAGNTITVAVRSGAGIVVNTVTDTAGNSYVRLTTAASFSTRFELWAAWDVLGHGSNIVTATFASASTSNGIGTVQYSGVSETPVTGMWTASRTLTVPGVTTTIPNSVIVSWAQMDASDVWTPGSGFSTVGTIAADSLKVLYCQQQIVASLVSGLSVACTNSAGSPGFDGAVFVVALAEGGGGGGGGGGGSYAFVG